MVRSVPPLLTLDDVREPARNVRVPPDPPVRGFPVIQYLGVGRLSSSAALYSCWPPMVVVYASVTHSVVDTDPSGKMRATTRGVVVLAKKLPEPAPT